MIRTVIDEMRPADAYQMGWLDRDQQEDLDVDMSKYARRLDAILDRAEAIAPWKMPAVAKPEAAVFDQEDRT